MSRASPRSARRPPAVYFDQLNERVKDNRHLETAGRASCYFEYHRGTYTSMARNKRGNRKSELMMMDLELLGVLARRLPR